MPNKFLLTKYTDEDVEREAIQKFDKKMSEIRIPKMLLERLRMEFDQNYKVSVQATSTPEASAIKIKKSQNFY
jgi:hypothetical protein